MLTVVTVCISLPTMIAGIYGMNFENMPELKLSFGYFAVLVVMFFSAVLPYLYFKYKSGFEHGKRKSKAGINTGRKLIQSYPLSKYPGFKTSVAVFQSG